MKQYIPSLIRNYNEEILDAVQEDGSPNGATKWSDHEEDMREISKQWPGVVFCVNGIGEDWDDIWDQYFKDGKAQMCGARIEFDPYDPNKLE
jgi:hypothetical protein